MSTHHLLKLPSQTQSSLSKSLLFKLQTTLNSHPLFQFHYTLSPKPNHFLLPLCRSSRWDPNAESFKNKTLIFNFNKNGTAKSKYFHEGDEDGDDELKSEEVWVTVMEEYIDSIWILKDNVLVTEALLRNAVKQLDFTKKSSPLFPDPACASKYLVDGVSSPYLLILMKLQVFNSYGWSLPFIILSILLASGIKAFLMALALPLAQSTIWFLLQKIWSSTKYKTRHNMKSKRMSRERQRSSPFTVKRDRKEKREYPSWVSGKDISADNLGNDGDSGFGGWDELDWGREFTGGSPKSDQRASRSKRRPSENDNFTRL